MATVTEAPPSTVIDKIKLELATLDQISAEEKDGSVKLVQRYLSKSKDEDIVWEKIKPPSDEIVMPYANLAPLSDDPTVTKSLLDKLAVLKLNGGLGTTMGCTGPKSVIEVTNGETFLDLIVQQIELDNNVNHRIIGFNAVENLQGGETHPGSQADTNFSGPSSDQGKAKSAKTAVSPPSTTSFAVEDSEFRFEVASELSEVVQAAEDSAEAGDMVEHMIVEE